MSRALKEPNRCKGQVPYKNSFRRCPKSCWPTGYCEDHQPPPGRKPVSHGIYFSKCTPAEKEALDRGDFSGDLERELLAARIIANRALDAWEKWSDERALKPEDLPVQSATMARRALPGPDGQVRMVDDAEIKRSRPDLWTIIDRALGRIGRLAEQQATVVEVRDLQAQLEEMKKQLTGSMTEGALGGTARTASSPSRHA